MEMTNEEAIQLLKKISIKVQDFSDESKAISKAIEALEKEKPKTCGMCMDFWKCNKYIHEDSNVADQCVLFKEKR